MTQCSAFLWIIGKIFGSWHILTLFPISIAFNEICLLSSNFLYIYCIACLLSEIYSISEVIYRLLSKWQCMFDEGKEEKFCPMNIYYFSSAFSLLLCYSLLLLPLNSTGFSLFLFSSSNTSLRLLTFLQLA